jgi:hypothetical protein
MPVQLRHPKKAAPLSPGVLHSKHPINLQPGQIHRGNYCHRYFICANQNKIDPDQTVCLICSRFIPLFPKVDPLAQAKVMGYRVGFKLIKQALVFEAQAELKAAKEVMADTAAREQAPDPQRIICCVRFLFETDSPADATPVDLPAVDMIEPLQRESPASSKKPVKTKPVKKTKLNGRKPKTSRPGRPPIPGRPEPGPGEKRCSNPNCPNPILPATPEYFHRNRTNKDGWNYYCKPCQAEKQARANEKNKLKNTECVEAGPPISREVQP